MLKCLTLGLCQAVSTPDHGAVLFLTSYSFSGEERLRYGGMVCLEDGNLHVMSFEELTDQETGRTSTRHVDTCAEHYRVARQYMIRMEKRDLDAPATLAKLAEAAVTTPDAFKAAFGPAVDRCGG